jgi:hypothetical protein
VINPILGLIVVIASIAYLLFGGYLQLTRKKTDSLFLLVWLPLPLTFASFYIGFRLMGLPLYIISMLYCVLVFPLISATATADSYTDGRAIWSSDKRMELTLIILLAILVMIPTLAAGYGTLEITPFFQQSNRAVNFYGIKFTWIETTHYSKAYIKAAYKSFYTAFKIDLVLLAIWFVLFCFIFYLHRQERKVRIAKIKKLRSLGMYKAALGLCNQTLAMFPKDKELESLKVNVQLYIREEEEKDYR